MSLKLVLDQILNGIIMGSMYSLSAAGLTLIWGTMKMLNFAYGEYYMLGAYLGFYTMSLTGIPQGFAILIATGVVFLVGLLTERLIIHPLLDKPGWEVSPVVATMGISVFLQNFALKIWGERVKNIPYIFEGTLDVFGFRIAYQRLLILAVGVIAMGAFWFFIKKSRFGMAIRATAQERESSTLIGINYHRVYMITFGISSAMAALAALMLAPIYSINPWMGSLTLVKAIIVAVLGGLGSVEGAMVAGIVLGIAESFGVIIFSSEWKDVFSYIIMIMVLTIRPSGFFGKKEW
jgi:branched-chain amino acid transport system permease protein